MFFRALAWTTPLLSFLTCVTLSVHFMKFVLSPMGGYLLGGVPSKWLKFVVFCGIHFVLRKPLCIYHTKETCPATALSPCSIIMGRSRYSPAARIIHLRNVSWSLASNIQTNSSGSATIHLPCSGGGTTLSLVMATAE